MSCSNSHYLLTHQSGIRRLNSTETLISCLLHVGLYILLSKASNFAGSFDVSTAFDTEDHSILLQHLETSLGISEFPLVWIRSFLSDHLSQTGIFGPMRSPCSPIPWSFLLSGLPQGCVLAPLLYILYRTAMD